MFNKCIEALRRTNGVSDVADKIISKISRIGMYVHGRIRPIRAHFGWHHYRKVLRNKANLPKGVYVHEDFPEEVEERRRILRPILKAAKNDDSLKLKSKLVADKLVIDSKVFTVDVLDTLPDKLQLINCLSKFNEHAYVFTSSKFFRVLGREVV